MSNGIGIMIEGLVAILLMLTVGYCMLLNRRLKLLKADEHSLRATISEIDHRDRNRRTRHRRAEGHRARMRRRLWVSASTAPRP